MKTRILLMVSLWGIWSFLWPNIIDDTPITKFSELIFADDDNWTMEISFPFGYRTEGTDSIVLKVANNTTRLKTKYKDGTLLGLLTPDSLSIPLTINRQGDSLLLYTYSSLYGSQVRVDGLIFGNASGASVGQPVSGYSIMRLSWREYYNNITVDCLTQNQSPGAVNDTTGLGATLEGHIYDRDSNPVTKLQEVIGSPAYFELHAPLTLAGDGTYRARIFRRFETETVTRLSVRLMDFDGWRDTVSVDSFKLDNIVPHSTIVQDIHLQSNDYVVTGVENLGPPQTSEIELINYPNPFNVSTNFFVKIPGHLQGKAASIGIYNASGQLVKMLHLEQYTPAKWDGTDENGSNLPTGIYYYRLYIEKQIMKSGSMILLK